MNGQIKKLNTKKNMWIDHYKVSCEHNGSRKIEGVFQNNASDFTVELRGKGDNDDFCKITLSGDQFEMEGKPIEITIIGSWEFEEFVELVKLIKKIK